jgi:amphi-Trp domain-containing protein
MTEQDPNEQDAALAEAEADAEPAAEADAETEGDDTEDDEDDDKAKPDKPKKVKISYEAAMPRNEAVSYFEAIVGGLRSGRLEFKQDGDELVLSPPDQLQVEVKAQRKGDKAKVVFEIEWTDDSRPLEIIN